VLEKNVKYDKIKAQKIFLYTPYYDKVKAKKIKLKKV
jgi:hypothetical protein